MAAEDEYKREMKELMERGLEMSESEPEFIFDNWFYVLTARVKCRYFNSKRNKTRRAAIFSTLPFMQARKSTRKGTKNVSVLHIGCRQLIGYFLHSLYSPILSHAQSSYVVSASANYGNGVFLRELWAQKQTSKADFQEHVQSTITLTTGVA